MKKPMQLFPTVVTAVVTAVLVLTQTAYAQNDPGMQAAQQAAQAAQQASQQAMQDMQTAAQNAQAAQQAAQNAAQDSSSLPRPVHIPPPPQTPGGPLPAQIASAHTVLLTNGGVTARLALDSNQMYNDIHKRMEVWGYYQLVSTPQEADLIFQLEEIAPHNGDNVTPATNAYNRTPSFRVTISDAKTGTVLWTVTSPIVLAGKKTYAQWIDVSEQNLISRLKVIAKQPLTAQESAALTQFPKTHYGLTAWVIAGGTVAFAVGGFFLIHHLYEDGLANAKAQQDAFCKANHIPLSECAGG